MNVEAIGKIRDARGLTTNEKVFLYTVASHKDGMFKTHDKNYDDMDISKATYYRVRGELIKKDLVVVCRRMDNSTVYMINDQGLVNWLKSHTETNESHTETFESHCETIESLCAETKDNLKSNKKSNLKNNKTSTSASAPVLPSSQNETNKDDQEEVQPPAAAPADSLIGSTELDAPLIDDVLSSSKSNPQAGSRDGAEKGSSRPAVIAEWRVADREIKRNNFGLESDSERFAEREGQARQELTKVVDNATRAGSAREDWNNTKFEEAVALMMDRKWNDRMFKMVDRAYRAYGAAGVVLEW